LRSIDIFYHQNTIFRSTTLQNEVKYLLTVKNWRHIRLKGYFSDGHYLKAAAGGILTAEAQEVSRNRKIATYSIRITDDSGDLVASFQGMVYRKKDKFPV